MCIEHQWVAQSYVDMLDTFVIVRLIGMCGIFVGKCPFPTQNLGKATTFLTVLTFFKRSALFHNAGLSLMHYFRQEMDWVMWLSIQVCISFDLLACESIFIIMAL